MSEIPTGLVQLGDCLKRVGGKLTLADTCFDGTEFQSLDLFGMVGDEIYIRNVTFRNCRIWNGVFLISGGGAFLENVTFENIRFKLAEIDLTTNILQNVVIIDKRKNVLLHVFPQDFPDKDDWRAWKSQYATDVGVSLDLTQFAGLLEVYGIAPARYKINHEIHAFLTLPNSGELPFELKSWSWRCRVSTINSHASDPAVPRAAIVDIRPPKDDREVFLQELELLRSAGYLT